MAMGGDDIESERGWALQLAQPLLVLDAALVTVIDRYLMERRCRE